MNCRPIIVPPRDLEKEKKIEMYHRKKEQARLKVNEQLLTGSSSSSSSSTSRRRPPVDPLRVCILNYVIIYLVVVVVNDMKILSCYNITYHWQLEYLISINHNTMKRYFAHAHNAKALRFEQGGLSTITFGVMECTHRIQ